MRILSNVAKSPRFGSVDLLIDAYKRNNQAPGIKIGVIPDGTGFFRLSLPKNRQEEIRDWSRYDIPILLRLSEMIARLTPKPKPGERAVPPTPKALSEGLQEVFEDVHPEKWTLWSYIGDFNSQDPLNWFHHEFDDPPDYPKLPENQHKWLGIPPMFFRQLRIEQPQAQQQQQQLTCFTPPPLQIETDSRNYVEKTLDTLKELGIRNTPPKVTPSLDWRSQWEWLYE